MLWSAGLHSTFWREGLQFHFTFPAFIIINSKWIFMILGRRYLSGLGNFQQRVDDVINCRSVEEKGVKYWNGGGCAVESG